jgi:DNA modification methylase
MPLKNRVINDDVFNVFRQLPDASVDCVYADPDYNVGIKYNGKNYKKSFDKYIEWCIRWAREGLRVLKDTGNMFIINYPKNNAHLRVKYLDDVCYDVRDYAWCYNTNVGHSKSRFTTAHRSILHCRKTAHSNFYKDNVAQPYKNPTDKRILANLANGSKGTMPYSWFYFNLVKNVSKQKTAHVCQIPEQLSEMLIKSCTQHCDSVFILFGGSGSEAVVCERLQRHFICTEIDPTYYQVILTRLDQAQIGQD